MSWEDRLREASFRGVPFKVAQGSTTAGRRFVIHQFVNRTLPYAEDLGRKALTFKIEAFVLGDDYDLERDTLLNAVQEPGPGVLVHPNLGRKTVACLKGEVLEEFGSNRLAIISLEFTEVGEKRFPDSSPDHLALSDKAAESVIASASEEFSSIFDADKVQQIVKDDAVSIFRKAVQSVEKIVGTIEQAEEDAARSAATIDRYKRETFEFITSPGIAAQRYLAVLDILNGTRSYKKLATGLRAFYTFGSDQSEIANRPSVSSRKLKDNRDVQNRFIRASALAKLGQAASRASLPDSLDVSPEDGFSSVAEAALFRDELNGEIDGLLKETRDDSLYVSLVDLRNGIANSVPGNSSRLKIVRTHTTTKTVPSLVLAHNLYGDAAREEEITVRNTIEKPGFIPAGLGLEVTVDA